MSENGNSIFRVPITIPAKIVKIRSNSRNMLQYIYRDIYIFFFLSFSLSPYLDNLDGDGKRRRTFSLEGRKEKERKVEWTINWRRDRTSSLSSSHPKV